MTSNQPTHDELRLRLALYDRLPALERQQVDEHLQSCAECTMALVQYQAMAKRISLMVEQKRLLAARQSLHNPVRNNMNFTSLRKKASSGTTTSRTQGATTLSSWGLAGYGILAALLLAVVLLATNQQRFFHLASTAPPTPEAVTPAPTHTATMLPNPDPKLQVGLPSQRITVTFASYDPNTYRALAEQFEKENPDLHINLVMVQELASQSDLTAPDWISRVLPKTDVLALPAGPLEMLNGSARPLDELIERDPTFDRADFHPGLLDAKEINGQLWSLPLTLNAYLIFFDKEAFDRAGVAYPKAGWNWMEFVETARTLTQRAGDEVTQWGYADRWGDSWQLAEIRAGGWFDFSTTPPQPRLLHPQVIDAIRWYKELVQRERLIPHFAPGANGTQGTAMEDQLVQDGKLAMWSDFGGNYVSMAGSVGVAPFPIDETNSKTTPVIDVDSVTLSANSQVADAAWRWMVFLSHHPPGGLQSQFPTIPARKSLTQNPEAWQSLSTRWPDLVETLRFVIDHHHAMRFELGERAIAGGLASLFDKEESLETTLSEMEGKARIEIAAGYEGYAQWIASSVDTSASGTSAESSTAAITLRFFSTSLEPNQIIQWAERFEEQNPTLNIELIRPMMGSNDVTKAAAESDCFDWYPDLEPLKAQALVLPLEPFLAVDPSLAMNDFFPNLLQQFTVDGQLWALPGNIIPAAIEYNPALFDQAGVPYPDASWTIDDFFAIAVKLTTGSGSGKQFGFAPSDYEGTELQLVLERLGASWIDLSTTPPSFALNTPSMVTALQRYVDFTIRDGAKPILATTIAELMEAGGMSAQRTRLINNNRASMWLHFPMGNQPGMERKKGRIVSLPRALDGSNVGRLLSASGYFISAQSQQPQACWQWIRFLTEQADVRSGLPARRSVIQSSTFAEQVGAENVPAYIAAIEAGNSPLFDLWFTHPWVGDASYWLDRAYGQALRGEKSVAIALAEAQQAADAYRSCVIDNDAYTEQSAWRACLQKADPTIPASLTEMIEQ